MKDFASDMKRCGIRTATEESSPVGVALLPNGFSLRVTPGRNYYVVRIAPEIPAEIVEAVNNRRHIEDGGAHSTHDGRLGGLARAHGFAGGLFGDHLRKYTRGRGVGLWHVDTVEALRELVVCLRAVIAGSGLTADEALRESRTATTCGWLQECEPLLRQDDMVGKILRDDLHTNRDLDGDDPRIVALRAEFPREHVPTPGPVCPAPTGAP